MSFPRTVLFTTPSLLEKGNVGAQNVYREVTRTMNGKSSPDNWKHYWTLLLSKQTVDDTENELLTLGTRLGSAPPKDYQFG